MKGLKVIGWVLLIINLGNNNKSLANNVDIWSFREDNINNVDVKAYYTGPGFTKDIGDFSICFRYKILYFNSNANGVKLISAENNKEKFYIQMFNGDSPNLILIQTKEGKNQIYWFRAEVPLRLVF